MQAVLDGEINPGKVFDLSVALDDIAEGPLAMDERRAIKGPGQGQPSGRTVLMQFTRSGGETATGPADWFTGTVYIDGIRNPDEQSAVGCAHVRFTPGARTAWHTHSKGRPSTSPTGSATWPRSNGVQAIRPGDVVYIEPQEEHWHGATADRFMAHVAIQEVDATGQVVTWLDHVTDEEHERR